MNPAITIAPTLLLLALAAPPAWGQTSIDPLARRGFFGVALGTGDDTGVPVTSVLDNSTAMAAGVRPGDVIEKIDELPVKVPADVIAIVGKHVSGDEITIDLIRDGQRQRQIVGLKPFPYEQMAGAQLEYGSVSVPEGVQLRTIISVPDGEPGRFPAVMLVQGGGCGSIEAAIGSLIGQPGLMHTIGANGFVTMRVDKSGVGDSTGAPCDSIGYNEELAGYRAALQALRLHPAVNPDRVFLLGISLGGVFAPILARETNVAGIAVYGTLAAPPSAYPGRSERFFREFAAQDIAAAWAAIDAPVVVLHGEYDASTSADDHVRIAAIVNTSHPGTADHQELPKLDHCWSRHSSLQESLNNCGRGEATADLSNAILMFLKAHS